jgi:CO/xanthine dehydrogenase Mo-binding subunit
MRRVEDPRLLSGNGRFVEDVQAPKLLHLALSRSPHPSARLASVRIKAALEATAPTVHPELQTNICYSLQKEGGDVERAFRVAADVVVRLRVDNPRVAPIALEPCASNAMAG